jgi:glyoxylase-like metal-dependent hydrolase (beta-lactamase superfamily II)
MQPSLLLLSMSSLALAGSGCAGTSHGAAPSKLGLARSSAALLQALARPGPIEVETIASADWSVPRRGLINLDHPKARAAGLQDVEEPIQVYFHVLRHPRFGTFIIDTGVERALRDDPDHAALRGVVAFVAGADRLQVRRALGDWLAEEKAPLAGVLLTHLHLDHLSGMRDVPSGTPIYCGPGEAGFRSFENLFVQGTVDRALEGQAELSEWNFEPDPGGLFDGVIDVFGDRSLWALWVPGHTAGSTAYLALTADGPVLFTGDASHTRWGWENRVEPGTFSADQPRSAVSLSHLEQLVAAHPAIDVRLGHQRLEGLERLERLERL